MRLCTSQHYAHLWSPACFSVHCSFALGTMYDWNLFSVKGLELEQSNRTERQ